MKHLVLHPKTKQALDQLVESQSHAVLLTGAKGTGKYSVADSLASTLLGTTTDRAPYFLLIHPDGKSVTIEQIRQLQKFLQLKTTGKELIRRIAIIDSADTLTVEAQNALLKILEEPPEDTVIILTASKPHQLRPTIHSRVQTVSIMAPRKEDVLDFFLKKGHKGTDIDRSFMLSNGQVGLMTALLDGTNDDDLVKQIAYAKKLYGMSSFDRMTHVDELSKDKESLVSLLFACKRICTSALQQAASKNQRSSLQTWHKQLSLIVNAEESLKYNPNTKLLLTDLFIQM